MTGKELKKKRKVKGWTQAELAEKSGIPHGTIGRIEATDLRIKDVEKLLILNELFENEESNENVTKDYKLLSNKNDLSTQGMSFNDVEQVNQRLTYAENSTFPDIKNKPPRLEAIPVSLHPHQDDDDTGTAKFVYAPDGTMGMRVPIVPIKAQAGYLLGFADPEFYEDFETEIIPVSQEHKGTYLGFEVKGDSGMTTHPELMEQNIYPGWKVIGKDLPKQKWTYKLHIHKYDRWVLVHKTEGILIKSIVKHDVENGIITIHSLNPDYNDEELNLSDIEQIFNVVQIVPKKRQ